jgi:hypothetical protein
MIDSAMQKIFTTTPASLLHTIYSGYPHNYEQRDFHLQKEVYTRRFGKNVRRLLAITERSQSPEPIVPSLSLIHY